MPTFDFPQPVPLGKATPFFDRDIKNDTSAIVQAAVDKYKIDDLPDKVDPVEPVVDPAPPPNPAQKPVDFVKSAEEINAAAAAIVDKYKAADEGFEDEGDPKEGGSDAVTKDKGVTAGDEIPDVVDFGTVANYFADKGLINEVPEGFDVTNVTAENFWELVDHNIKRRDDQTYAEAAEATRKDLSARLSPISIDLLNWQLANPNSTDEDVRIYMEQMLYNDSISQLEPTDLNDAETIIREFKRMEGWGTQEIEDEIADLKTLNKLEARAQQCKPKLLQRQKAEQDKRTAEAQRIQQADEATHKQLMARVYQMLDSGKINEVPFNNEEKGKIAGILSNNRVPVKVNGGKVVELGYFDWLARKNMDPQTGNLENLALAALILEGGAKVLERYFKGPAQKAEAQKFASQVAGGKFKSSGTPSQSRPPQTPSVAERKAVFHRSLTKT